MAFTDSQRDQIRRYLGYPAAFRDQTYQLESMMDTVGDNATEQASVEAILTELATVDAALAAAGTSAQVMGALKAVDEIEFHAATGSTATDSMTAMKRAKMLVERLRQRFGVPLAGDYFGTGAFRSFVMALG
jgi:redox-regulated HSP33 family molecular chaperone